MNTLISPLMYCELQQCDLFAVAAPVHNLTWTRPSCSWLVWGAPSLWGMAASHPCSLEGLSSHQVNMLEYLGWFFLADLRTSASISMFPMSARPASTICAFVTSRVDYCNIVFAGAPKIINKLQWVLNSAAHVVSGTRKFDRGLRQLMHTELHWLDVPEHFKYKLGVITRRCLYGSAPRYLAACCVPVSTTASRQHLRFAAGHQLVIPSHRLTTYGRRAFSVAGPMFWNSLPRNLRDPSHTAAVFGRSLKTFLFSEY